MSLPAPAPSDSPVGSSASRTADAERLRRLAAVTADLTRAAGRQGVPPVVFGALVALAEWSILVVTGLATHVVILGEGVRGPGQAAVLGLVTLGLVAWLQILGAYDLFALRAPARQSMRLVALFAVLFSVVGVVEAVLEPGEHTVGWLAAWCLAASAVLVASRFLTAVLARVLGRHGLLRRRIAILGGGDRAAMIIGHLQSDPDSEINVCGIFDDRGDMRSPPVVDGVPRLGTSDDLVTFVRETGIDLVVFTIPTSARERALEVLQKLWLMPVDIRLVAPPRESRLLTRSHASIGPIPVLPVPDRPIGEWDVVLRWSFDKFVGSLALMLASPILMLRELYLRRDARTPHRAWSLNAGEVRRYWQDGEAASPAPAPSVVPLRIVHVFRAPVGGLFRHVIDVARAQAAAGHEVGVICDTGGGPRADAQLAALEPALTLGLVRIPMRRAPGPWDIFTLSRVGAVLSTRRADVVHGHGAKGGLLAGAAALLSRRRRFVTAYTPHGGSLNFPPGTKGHRLYMAVERFVARGIDVFTFESQFASNRYLDFAHRPRGILRVVRNGARPEEFVPVAPNEDAADLVFLGEFREAKGLFVLLDALDILRRRQGYEVSAALIGGGPEKTRVETRIAELGLMSVTVHEAMPARDALAMGRVFVLPSLFESLPYVIIEAAAGGLDIVATRVGGIAEAMAPAADRLVPPGDAQALAAVISATLDDDPKRSMARRDAVREHVRLQLSVDSMAKGIEDSYRAALAARG